LKDHQKKMSPAFKRDYFPGIWTRTNIPWGRLKIKKGPAMDRIRELFLGPTNSKILSVGRVMPTKLGVGRTSVGVGRLGEGD